MMRYLNKQNFSVSYMQLGGRSKKWENDVSNGESGTTPLFKGVSRLSSINNINKESKSISLQFDKF